MIGGRLSLAHRYAQAVWRMSGESFVVADFWTIRSAILFLKRRSAILSYLSLGNFAERQRINQLFVKHLGLKDPILDLLLLLQTHKRVALLPDILASLCDLLLSKNQKQFFIFESYPQLKEAQAEYLAKELQHLTGVEILYESYEKPSLIAGLRLQSRSCLYDNSISVRLRRCYQKLLGSKREY